MQFETVVLQVSHNNATNDELMAKHIVIKENYRIEIKWNNHN